MNIIHYIVGTCILIICIKYYFDNDMNGLNCITSNVDGNKYCVRERLKQEMAAEI